MGRYKDDPTRTGNALKDGFTCTARGRPSWALPGNWVSVDDTDSYDEMTDFMVEFGGRSAARRRIRRDIEDDDSGYSFGGDYY